MENFGPVPCPTCHKVNSEPCVRGRWPSAIWQQSTLFPEGHDSRRTVNSGKVLEIPS